MKKVDIGVFWHSLSSSNYGIGALTVGNLSLLNKKLNEIGITPKFKIFDFPSQNDYSHVLSNFEYEIVEMPRIRQLFLNRNALREKLSSCEIVIDISAGDSFADIYGLSRFLSEYITKKRTLDIGKKLILSPQTYGPFTSPIVRFMAGTILKKASLVFARDNKSFHVASDLKANSLYEVTDVAFAMPFTKIKSVDGEALKVGVNVSGLLYKGGYTGKNELQLTLDYLPFIDKLICEFLSKGAEVHLIPHVNGGTECDFEASKKIKEKFPDCVLPKMFQDPIEVKNYIATMDFFVGSRMHSTIAALSTGIPVVPVSYSRKFEGLFGSLNYNHVVNGKECDNEEALRLILEEFGNIKQLQADVENTKEIIDAKLAVYTSTVSDFVKELYAL